MAHYKPVKNNNQNETRVVIRLRRSTWHDAKGIYQRVELKYLKRECTGWNFLHEDCQNMDADELIPRIVNLNTCEDGIYRVEIVNEYRDWETGYIEDYDYKLVPFNSGK